MVVLARAELQAKRAHFITLLPTPLSIPLAARYDEPLSHLIYAACDMIVVPSMFEPCGLTQMIAMRYGAGGERVGRWSRAGLLMLNSFVLSPAV